MAFLIGVFTIKLGLPKKEVGIPNIFGWLQLITILKSILKYFEIKFVNI